MKKINIESVPSAYERSMLIFLGYSGSVNAKCSLEAMETFINTYLPNIKQKINMPDTEEIRDNRVRFYDSALEHYQQMQKEACWKIDQIKLQNINKKAENYIIEENIMDDESAAGKNILDFLSEGVNSGIYNICDVIIMLDQITELCKEFIEHMEFKIYDEAQIYLSKINTLIIFAESAVTQFIISMDKRSIMDFSLHHRILPDLPFYLKSTKTFLGCLNLLQEKMESPYDDDYFLACTPICMDMIKAKKKIDILKFILAFICIIRSPEYSREWKEYSYEIIKMYKDLLYKGTIYKVYLQMNQLTGTKEERGNNNGVTRVQFLFELCNDDIYSLRLDMPHKGEECIHANLPEKNKELINNIYQQQSHRKINCNMTEECAVDFWNEINMYLERFHLTNLLEINIKKDDEMMIKSLSKIYLFQDYYSLVFDLLLEKPDLQIPLKKYIYEAYKSFGLEEHNVDEKSFLEMELENILYLIDHYCI